MSRRTSSESDWRRAQEATPRRARSLLLGIDDPAEVPDVDRDAFLKLRAMTEGCPSTAMPLSANAQCVATIRGHEDSVCRVDFSADGRLLVSCGDFHGLRLWSVPGGECLAVLRGYDAEAVRGVLTPDGSLLVKNPTQGRITLSRMPDEELVANLIGHEGMVRRFAMAPSGDLLASASYDGTIRLWSISDRECLGTFTELGFPPDVLVIAPGGDWLASARGFDETIHLWHLPHGEYTAKSDAQKSVVSCLAFTPDGRQMVSGGWDDTVRLWRMPQGECIATLRGHEDSVMSLAVAPDGCLLASGSADGSIRLWGSQVARLIESPVADLVGQHDMLIELKHDTLLSDLERAWLDFTLALVEQNRRFDIEVEVSTPVDVGSFDIEIGS